MRIRGRLSIGALSLAVVVSAGAQVADNPAEYLRPSENVALGKPYTLQPAPNYSYCTEPGDTTQLTDGVYSEGYFWTQPSTVGWRSGKPQVITIDLGSDQAIRGVSFRTAAGTAGVFWPAGIYVFVAGDDQAFHWIGDLVSWSNAKVPPPKDGYATHRYWTDTLETHGRYVAFAVLSDPYTFLDEIEVYAGDVAWTGSPLPGDGVPDIKAFMNRLSVRMSVERRISADETTLRELTEEASIDDAVKGQIIGELDAVRDGLTALPADFGPDFRAILPLNDLHARVFRAQARLWEAQGGAPLTVWQSPLWDAVTLFETPKLHGTPQLAVNLMRNEYRAAAFNVSNATQEAMDLTLRLTGMPGGAAPPYITVHEVAWTDTKSLTPVAAALPEAKRDDDGYRIRVESGLTRQVWLTFHPTDLAPGTYEGMIDLSHGNASGAVPLTMTVYPLDFPEHPRLHCGGWDYTDQPSMYMVTPQNREPLIAHLREHFVDSPWGTSACMPHGTYDADGVMTEPPDTSHFDAWIDRWPGSAQYCVFASVRDHLNSMAMDTPEFAKAAAAWFTFWADHARQRGLKPEQLAVLLYDEPHSAEDDAIIFAWAKALRAANTGIRIWEDPTYRDINEANPEMLALCDVVCPNRPIFLRGSQASRDLYVQLRDGGVTLEFYSCSGPMRLLDPYMYCRLQPWTAWQYGAKASYFWAFGDDGGGSSWNEYAAERTAYTPVFLDATSVTAGKHMEAIREGIEDYEYLAILQDAIESAPSHGVDDATIAQARTLLTELPARVCQVYEADPGFWWKADCDRTVADAARREILDTLVVLKYSRK